MKPAPFGIVRAQSVTEAVRHLAASDGGARIMGGGQSLVPMLNLRLASVSQIIDLSQISELKQAEVREGVATYAAGVTHAQIEDALVPDVTHGLMRKVAAGIAYRAIRNRGTMAGSLALSDPSADWVSVLIALNADVELVGSKGERTVDVRSFVIGAYTTLLEDDELIRAIRVPVLPEDARWGYFKSCRKRGEFAQSLAAVVAAPSESFCRIVVGATDGVPVVLDGMADCLRIVLEEGWRESWSLTVHSEAKRGLRDVGISDDFMVDLHAASVLEAVKEATSK